MLSLVLFSCEKEPVMTPVELESFSILRKHNPRLRKDIRFTIEGERVTGVLPEYMTSTELVANFSVTRDQGLYVDGVLQDSGHSVQDFSHPIIYELPLAGGVTKKYEVILEREEEQAPADLPVIRITTENGQAIDSKKNYVRGTITVEDKNHRYWDTTTFIAPMAIKGRGNTSWNFPKKPYRVKLDVAEGLFGYRKNRDWILLADYVDKTLLRNTVGMEISRIVGMDWSPAMINVEVWLNGKYEGCYTFTENKEISKGRVDIHPIGPLDNQGEALTGDYYLEIDQELDKTVSWWTEQCRIPLMCSEPDVLTPQQEAYIKNYFASTEQALLGPDFQDPVTGYAQWIKVDSFVNAFIVNELTKNPDGNLRKSTYLTKERGKKLKLYHLWDFDLAMGNCNYLDQDFQATNGPEGWFVKTCSLNEVKDPQHKSLNWYVRLFEDPAFCQRVKEKWNAVRPELEKIPDFIRQQTSDLERGAAERNFKRWDIMNQKFFNSVVVPGTYAGEVEYLIDFYTRRFQWMDAEIAAW